MFTEEPHDFETETERKLQKQLEEDIDRSFPDYTDIDWDYYIKLEKKQTLINNIEHLLNRYKYKFKIIPNGYRIFFKDQKDYFSFRILQNNSGCLKLLKPEFLSLKLNISGFEDFKFS